MGGENAPEKNIEGISIFLKKNKNKSDFFFIIYGDENLISIKFFILLQWFLMKRHL